jgi:hypothetical protein
VIFKPASRLGFYALLGLVLVIGQLSAKEQKDGTQQQPLHQIRSWR